MNFRGILRVVGRVSVDIRYVESEGVSVGASAD